jgi:hypothetical protein
MDWPGLAESLISSSWLYVVLFAISVLAALLPAPFLPTLSAGLVADPLTRYVTVGVALGLPISLALELVRRLLQN